MSTSDHIVVPQEIIEQKIFLIRGQKVMLAVHLAQLYGTQTRVLMQAVKRNMERFPSDFAFPLKREEIMRISQTVISLKFSKSVYVFTEQGVAMLSSVLHTKEAVQVNIAIMRAFVRLRKILQTHKHLAGKLTKIEKRLEKHDKEILAIFGAINNLMTHPDESYKRTKIGFITSS